MQQFNTFRSPLTISFQDRGLGVGEKQNGLSEVLLLRLVICFCSDDGSVSLLVIGKNNWLNSKVQILFSVVLFWRKVLSLCVRGCSRERESERECVCVCVCVRARAQNAGVTLNGSSWAVKWRKNCSGVAFHYCIVDRCCCVVDRLSLSLPQVYWSVLCLISE
jgi:hypothetical protein